MWSRKGSTHRLTDWLIDWLSEWLTAGRLTIAWLYLDSIFKCLLIAICSKVSIQHHRLENGNILRIAFSCNSGKAELYINHNYKFVIHDWQYLQISVSEVKKKLTKFFTWFFKTVKMHKRFFRPGPFQEPSRLLSKLIPFSVCVEYYDREREFFFFASEVVQL